MGRLRRHADHGHALSLGWIQQRTENQAQEVAGASHATAAGDTRGAQTRLRKPQGRANGEGKPTNLNIVLNRQILPVLNAAASAGNKNSLTLLLRIHTSTLGMVVYLSGTGSAVSAVDSLLHSTVSEWMT